MKATILLLPIYLFNAVNVQNTWKDEGILIRETNITEENIEITDYLSNDAVDLRHLQTQNYYITYKSDSITDSTPMGAQTTTGYFKSRLNVRSHVLVTEVLLIQKITPYNYAIPEPTQNLVQAYAPTGLNAEWEYETGKITQMPYISMNNESIYETLSNPQIYETGQAQGHELNTSIEDDRQYGNETTIYWYLKGTTTLEPNQETQCFVEIDSTITYTPSQVIVVQGQEVIDIPGMMLEILAMPFAFISQAFNLTLFPGTPYQVNLANTILVILGILVLFVVLKIVLKIFL